MTPIPVCITIDRKQAEASWDARQRGEEPLPVDIEIEYSDQYTPRQAGALAVWLFQYLRMENWQELEMQIFNPELHKALQKTPEQEALEKFLSDLDLDDEEELRLLQIIHDRKKRTVDGGNHQRSGINPGLDSSPS